MKSEDLKLSMTQETKMQVIPAGPGHAPAIATIGRRSFSHAFAHLFNHQHELQAYLDYTYNEEKISRSIQKEKNIFFVSLKDDRPVGFLKLKKNSLNQQINSFMQTELQKIYVLPEFHGSGPGAALMQAGIDWALRAASEIVWLDVHISNLRAIRFYENHGFSKHGKHFFNIGTQTFEYHLMTLRVSQQA